MIAIITVIFFLVFITLPITILIYMIHDSWPRCGGGFKEFWGNFASWLFAWCLMWSIVVIPALWLAFCFP